MIKLSKICIIFLIMLAIPTLVNAISSQWTCESGDPPFGDIDITYTDENAANKAEIFAISPQKHPIIYPDGKLILQLKSKNCFEYTMKVKDSSGAEISQYSSKPYSPYPKCNIPSGESIEGTTFLTMIEFNAPINPGKYNLDIYDNENVLLTTGAIEILDLSTIVSSVSRTSWCTIDNSKYTVILDAPYPVVFEANNPGEINVIIRGQDTSAINEMFEQISMSISPQYAAQISLTKAGSPICSNSECRQDYSLTSTASTSAIAYVWHAETAMPSVMQSAEEGPQEQSGNVETAINSEGITILDIGKLKEIKSKLDTLSSTSAEYVEYYNSINDDGKAQIWQNVYDKVNSISNEINELIPVLESRNFRVSDVVDLINIVEKSQKDMDDMINSLSGV